MDLLEGLLIALATLVVLWLALVVGLAVAGRGAAAREVAAFLPNLLFLFRGLIADARVPRRAKIALALGAAYLALPIDLVPDFIPVAGQADDAIVAALVLRYVLGSTDRAVLREHWRGDPRTLDQLLSLARV